MKRLETSKNKQASRWILAAVLGLLVCLSFYAFLTALTVFSSIAFDFYFWAYPRLFFESFEGNASLLFISLSVYMGFSFFLFVTRSIRLKNKQYSLRSRKRLGSTEFQGRAWVVLYIVLSLCAFHFVGFAFEDFHLPIATDPFFSGFIKMLTLFVFCDIIFTFHRIVAARWTSTLFLGGGVLLLGVAMMQFSGSTWKQGKTLVERHRALFDTKMDLPVVSFSSDRGIWRAEISLVLDSNGVIRVFDDSREYPLDELYSVFNRHHIRTRAQVKVYADRKLPISHLYQLDRETACFESRIFYYMTQLEGAPQQKWWENYSSHYIPMRLMQTECSSIRSPPPPPPPFPVQDTLYITGEKAIYKEQQLGDKELEVLLRTLINPEGFIAVYFTADCTYERYLKTVGMVFETAYHLRDAYSMEAFDSLYGNLWGIEHQRSVKEKYPIRILDLSRMEYHAERDTSEF